MTLVRAFVVAALLLGAAMAQEAEEWLERGHQAAARSEHLQAITNYEEALRRDSSLATPLAGRLGRQYLWAEQAERALPMLQQALAAEPGDCPLRLDYALALSWADRLSEARQAYADAQWMCPEQKLQAQLGEIRVLSWSGEWNRAERKYRDIQNPGTAAQSLELIRAQIELARDDNRAAAIRLERLIAGGFKDPGAYEALAAARRRFGDEHLALQTLQQARTSGVDSPRFARFEAEVLRARRLTVEPRFTYFRDRDGTRFRQLEFGVFDVLGNATVGVMVRHGQLSRSASTIAPQRKIDSQSATLSLEHRFTPTLALAGSATLTDFDQVRFRFPAGELNAIITPTDRLRFDVSAAGITIADAFVALDHHLSGRFLSAGGDWRFLHGSGINAATDVTHWSEGNRRTRIRLVAWHHLDDKPQLTISVPLMIQTYDHGFNFGLFSPKFYLELGPAVELKVSPKRHWELMASGRLGAQRESGLAWSPLGTLRFSVQRALDQHWGMSASFAHSSSNLASSTGFSRTRGEVGLKYRF